MTNIRSLMLYMQILDEILHGVQGGIRPGIVVSCDASNHGGAPQISVVPLSSKLKE